MSLRVAESRRHRVWHCYSWVHRAAHGSGCARTHAACEAERGQHMTTIPCRLQTGSAWCSPSPSGGPPRCYESVWACQRQGGAACVRDP